MLCCNYNFLNFKCNSMKGCKHVFFANDDLQARKFWHDELLLYLRSCQERMSRDKQKEHRNGIKF